MKIVHVCVTSPWSEIYAYQENLLPHYHRMMGHSVTIIAPVFSKIGDFKGNRFPVGESLLQDGAKLVRIKPLIDNRLILSHFPTVKGLKSVIVNERPDLVFFHDICCLNYKCIRTIKNLFPGVKIVMDNHADYVNSLHSILTQFLHKFIYRFCLVKRIIPYVEWFYGVTPSRCTFLQEVYGVPRDKVKLLIMGADDAKMRFDERDQIRQNTRERYSIDKDDFLVVTGGKIDLLKNIHVLAHAVNSLNRPNLKLLIFGEIKENIKSLFDAEESSSIIKTGWVESDKVYDLFYAADLIMFPGLHSVLWEQAVASKTPCAFSKMKGFEHVNVNNNCILMTGKDSSYYEDILRDLLEDKEHYISLKNNSESGQTDIFYYSKIASQVLSDVGV